MANKYEPLESADNWSRPFAANPARVPISDSLADDIERRRASQTPPSKLLIQSAHIPAVRMERLPLVPPLPKAREYPVAALGPTLGAAAESIARKCQCALPLAAQSALAVASLVTQHIADVRLPYGQTRPLSLYFVTIAGSGDRKSTADNEALGPVRTHETRLKDEYAVAHESWRVAFAAWAAQHKKIEGDRNLDRQSREAELLALGRAPLEPLKPYLTAPEPTVESLAKNWQTLPGGLGLFSAEGGQMTGGHGFGPDHRLKTAAALSSLWDGSGIRRFRAGDGITDLPGRRLAAHLMIQPDAAAAFLADPILRDQGLLSRLLVAAPESLAGTRAYRQPAEAVASETRRYFAAIVGLLERPALASNDAGNELTPRVLDLEDDARTAWIAFHDRIEIAMRPDGAFDNLRDVASKAAENAARIAGVLTIVRDSDAAGIDGAAMLAGCELMTWYLSEALRLGGLVRQPPGLRNAIRLLEWFQAKGRAEVSRSEIMQFGPAVVRQKKEADAALTILEDHGLLMRSGDGRGAKWTLTPEGPQ